MWRPGLFFIFGLGRTDSDPPGNTDSMRARPSGDGNGNQGVHWLLRSHVTLIGRGVGGVVLVAVSCFWARGDHRHKPHSVFRWLRWTILGAEWENLRSLIRTKNGDCRINQRHFYRHSLLSLKLSLRQITRDTQMNRWPIVYRVITKL